MSNNPASYGPSHFFEMLTPLAAPLDERAPAADAPWQRCLGRPPPKVPGGLSGSAAPLRRPIPPSHHLPDPTTPKWAPSRSARTTPVTGSSTSTYPRSTPPATLS